MTVDLLGGADDAVALIDAATDARVTYRALRARAAALGAELAAAAGPGGVCFAFVGNDRASIELFVAALGAGVPIALFDRRLDPALAAALVAHYQPEVVRGLDLPAGGGGAPAHPQLALLLSTSGTTGSRKLVRLGGAAVAANARAIAAALGLGPGEVAPTSLPVHYSYGLSVVTSHLVAGATVLVTDDGLLGEGFWAACRRHGATSLAGVPYSYQVLARLDLAKLAPPSLRTLTQAGGALAPAQVRRFHDLAAARGGRLFVMYGQTEACARIAVLPPAELPARAGAVGRAVPGGAVRIEVDGRPAAPDEIGDVIYAGPNVMTGYAEARADLARGDEQRGELRTGDRGRLDADGHLWIVGRSARLAKVFGVRVSLDELEALAAAAVPAGAAVAAVADGDRVRLHVEGGGDAAALVAHLAARTGLHPSGFAVTTAAHLPRLASGKLDYRALEAP